MGFKELASALEKATPDWMVVPIIDSENFSGEHLEIHGAYGRCATIYGEPEDPEALANATLMVLSQQHMADLLQMSKSLADLREGFLQHQAGEIPADAWSLLEQGILAGDLVTEALERLNPSLPKASAYAECQLSNDERALLRYPDSEENGPDYEVRHNNASVRSVCPICTQVFKPRIGDVLFLGSDPVCDDCDTVAPPAEGVETLTESPF